MTYRLPETLSSGDTTRAVTYLQRYFGGSDGNRYTGSYFDEWAEPQAPDVFTADDLVAVSFLSVFVSPRAAYRVLASERHRFSEFLADIGPDRDLADERQPVDKEHPIRLMYSALRELPGVGPTIASKLLARKRPRLVPIFDSVVAEVTNAHQRQWEPLRVELRKEGGALHARLVELGREAGLHPRISALRVYDVITWMEGKANKIKPSTAVERLGAELANLDGGSTDES